MARANPSFDRLESSYVFPEVARRVRDHAARNPGQRLLRLGIGDTTLPLPPVVIEAMRASVDRLADARTYTGYTDAERERPLRRAIADSYAARGVVVDEDEIFVSDGAKPDAAHIQSIFSPDSVVAVPDPVYPAYVDATVIGGRTGAFDAARGRYDRLVYLACPEARGFRPVPLESGAAADLVYLCSPNNPTGAVATRGDLEAFVGYARGAGAVIVFDAAYAAFIRDRALPRSIYEIEGARACAIEIASLSKSAGFTGVRLGWTIVPRALVAEDCPPGRLHTAWARRRLACFNGASNIAQAGAVAALSLEGQRACELMVDAYMENARIIRDRLSARGLVCYGGEHAPFVWLKTPGGARSWDVFDLLLARAQVVTTPGVGFGPAGERYIRLSAFGAREDTELAVERVAACLTG